jgi:hypothetical protein
MATISTSQFYTVAGVERVLVRGDVVEFTDGVPTRVKFTSASKHGINIKISENERRYLEHWLLFHAIDAWRDKSPPHD